MEPMTWIWVIAIAVFIVAELATTALISIWFAVGALAGLIASFMGLDWIVQLTAFLVVTILAFLIILPLARKIKKNPNLEIKSHHLIGERIIIRESLNESKPLIKVEVAGVDWNAVTKETEIVAGSKVEIVDIEGNNLVLKKII